MTEDVRKTTHTKARLQAYWLIAIALVMAAQIVLGDTVSGLARMYFRNFSFFLAALVLYPNARNLTSLYGMPLPFARWALVWLGVSAAVTYIERLVLWS